MRSSKAIFAAVVVAALVASTFAVAGALIASSSSSIIKLSPAPASVKLNALENATKVYAFDEAQGKTLTSAVAVDAVNPGTYGTFPSGNATVAAGTVVDSHLIHSDIPSKSYTAHRTGSVTFANDVLGVVASTTKLANSDSLGATGTLYAGTTTWRGLEGSGENGSSFGDKLTISADRRTVSFDIQTYVMDEIRVITKHTNPFVTTITDSTDPVQAGDKVTYTVTVTNTGSSTAAGVQVADEFPGATFVSANASGGCSGTVTVTCNLGSIAAGGSAAATIVVTTPSTVPAGGTITNTATSPPGQLPAGTATTTIVSPVLATAITDSPDPVTAGNDVQYTLTVTNNGISAVADAHVVDTLPPETAVVTSDGPSGCTGTGGGPVDCTLGSLAVGESKVAHVVISSPAAVPDGGTITNTAVASPGSNTPGSQTTTVEVPVDGVSKGFVVPGGSISIDGTDPATLSLPDTGDGAPVEITQGSGTFCDGPCSGTATTISEFDGYTDPTQPIHLTLTYNFPDSPTSLTDAATAFGSAIYKTEGSDPGTVVPTCTTPGSGQAFPHPCVDGKTITQPTYNSFVVTFEIVYLSGDPKFARK
ncbi:MAG: DUF7507 domain-containing protein [Acidimicrobiia bacterium]